MKHMPNPERNLRYFHISRTVEFLSDTRGRNWSTNRSSACVEFSRHHRTQTGGGRNAQINDLVGARYVKGLEVEGEAGFMEITVSDTGMGVSQEGMKRLFQPLFTTKVKGTGLGLVVCRNLTEANNGTRGQQWNDRGEKRIWRGR